MAFQVRPRRRARRIASTLRRGVFTPLGVETGARSMAWPGLQHPRVAHVRQRRPAGIRPCKRKYVARAAVVTWPLARTGVYPLRCRAAFQIQQLPPRPARRSRFRDARWASELSESGGVITHNTLGGCASAWKLDNHNDERAFCARRGACADSDAGRAHLASIWCCPHSDRMDTWRPPTGANISVEQALSWVGRLRGHAGRVGLGINPASRIARHEALLRRIQADARLAKTSWRELMHGTRDLFELLYICDVLAVRHLEALRAVLRALLKGCEVPDHEASSGARDFQFQTLLGAQFVAGGLHVEFEEPDFRFTLDGQQYGVAAKRVRSSNQIARRVKEGGEQLRRQGLAGFVALNVDALIQPAGKFLDVRQHDPDFTLAARALLDAFQDKHDRQTFLAVRANRMVLGVCLSFTAVGFVAVPWQPAFTTALKWVETTPTLGPILANRMTERQLRD